MGSCTRRHYLLSICFLQMLAIVERQVFDFLGYMWAPILANFFHMIFVIFGFYGAYHFRVKYIIAYLIWNFIWIGWNSFLICFYLDIGILNKDSDILNLGTGSVSWFEVNGIGCKPVYPINITSEDPYRPVRPEYVQDCLVEYPIVEVIHSGIQCILSVLAILGAILIAYLFLDEDDQFDFMGGDAKSPQHTSVHPMYVSYTSIPTATSTTMLSNNINNNNNNTNDNNYCNNIIDKNNSSNHNSFNNSNSKNSNKKFILSSSHSDFICDVPTADKSMQNNYNITNHRSIIHSNNNNNNTNSSFIRSSSSSSSLQKMKSTRVQQLQQLNRKNTNLYSNFITSTNTNSINRPDIKYSQISTEQLLWPTATDSSNNSKTNSNNNCSSNRHSYTNNILDDSTNDTISLQTFKVDDSRTYIPFQKPSPISFQRSCSHQINGYSNDVDNPVGDGGSNNKKIHLVQRSTTSDNVFQHFHNRNIASNNNSNCNLRMNSSSNYNIQRNLNNINNNNNGNNENGFGDNMKPLNNSISVPQMCHPISNKYPNSVGIPIRSAPSPPLPPPRSSSPSCSNLNFNHHQQQNQMKPQKYYYMNKSPYFNNEISEIHPSSSVHLMYSSSSQQALPASLIAQPLPPPPPPPSLHSPSSIISATPQSPLPVVAFQHNVPRSPILNGSSSRNSGRRRHPPPPSVSSGRCDQIRNAPLQYGGGNIEPSSFIARARSHDRLSSSISSSSIRRYNKSRNNNPRPRSFCNNSNYTITEDV